MKTLNISISEIEYDKFGLKKENLSFSELLEIIHREIQKNNLHKSVELAQKYGLDKLMMEDINREISEVRRNAKGRH